LPKLTPTNVASLFSITDTTSLRLPRLQDAAELYALTDVNREHLRRWLPWLDAVQSEQHTREYLQDVIDQREAGRGPVFAIVHGRALAGVIGFHPIDVFHRVGEIGYWLAEAQQGQGIMTECCRFLVGYGFRTLELNRIQIPAATANYRSRAIPERLGFQLEGIIRGRENLYGTFVDHAMYSMLRSELPDSLNAR
jgi:ribosomal-protein-serine acetyltransferase